IDEPPPEKKEERKPPKKKNDDCDPILYPEGCPDNAKKAAPAPAPSGKDTLSKADILSVVKGNKADIAQCVGDQRKKDAAKAEGIIKMTWTIKKTGSTAAVSVASPEYANEYVGKCLTRAIQRWKFDAYTGGEIPPITFPF